MVIIGLNSLGTAVLSDVDIITLLEDSEEVVSLSDSATDFGL